MVVRAMALADNRDFGDAARIAAEILNRWPADAYAQRTGAALLSESRNGQDALNSAWTAVSLAPTDAEAHLVLAVVAARLRLFDLAQRAYTEALDLDPVLAEAQQDLGVVRLERRRWALALEQLADAASLGDPAGSELQPYDPGTPPLDPTDPRASHPAGQGRGRNRRRSDQPPSFPVSRPAGPVLDAYDESARTLRQAVLYGANGVLVAALLTAVMATASSGASRVWAAMIGVVVLVALVVWLSRQLSGRVSSVLSEVRRRDRGSAFAAYGTAVAPLLLVAYAVVGGLVPLIAAMVVAAGCELLVVTRRP